MNAALLLEHYTRIADTQTAIVRLRRFILDLAVRGKLVEQTPDDEPASDLLRRIAAEKAAKKKGKGELKLNEPENPALPKGWELVPLGDVVVQHQGGGTPSKANGAYWDGLIPWASVKDVGRSKFLDDTIDRITPEGLSNSSSNLVEPGNLIVVTRMGLGKVSINRIEVAINQDLRALTLSREMNVDYAYNFFLTHAFEGTGLTVKGIKVDELLRLPFPLPPFAEQRRIVDKVDELMALCDALEAARSEREAVRGKLTAASLARLNKPGPTAFTDNVRFALTHFDALTKRGDQIRDLRDTVVTLAVRGELVAQDPNESPASEQLKLIAKEKARLLSLGEITRDKVPSPLSETEEPFAIPSSWRWCRLRSLASRLGDGIHGTPHYTDGTGYYFVNGNNLEDGKIIIKENTKSVSVEEFKRHNKQLTENSVLVSINGTIGKVAFYDGQQIVLGKSACYINLTPFTDKRFAKIVLCSPFFAHYAREKATGTTIRNLSLNAMNELPFPLPPLAEQRRIVEKVGELVVLCDQLEASLLDGERRRSQLLEAILYSALQPVPSPQEDRKLCAA